MLEPRARPSLSLSFVENVGTVEPRRTCKVRPDRRNLAAVVVARVIPAVTDGERAVVGEQHVRLWPVGELLKLLPESVVPPARSRPCRLERAARLVPRGVGVEEEVGEQAAWAAVEPLRCSGGDGE